MKISISFAANRRCLGINNENCSCRPSDSGIFKSGIFTSPRTGITSWAVSVKCDCTSVPMLRKRSVKNVLGTSKTALFGPFATNTGSCGFSNNNNKSSFFAIAQQKFHLFTRTKKVTKRNWNSNKNCEVMPANSFYLCKSKCVHIAMTCLLRFCPFPVQFFHIDSLLPK